MTEFRKRILDPRISETPETTGDVRNSPSARSDMEHTSASRIVFRASIALKNRDCRFQTKWCVVWGICLYIRTYITRTYMAWPGLLAGDDVIIVN